VYYHYITRSWDSNPELKAIMACCNTIILPGTGTRTQTTRLSRLGVLPLYYQELGLEPRTQGYHGLL
jgi:hypothetical protein